MYFMKAGLGGLRGISPATFPLAVKPLGLLSQREEESLRVAFRAEVHIRGLEDLPAPGAALRL